MVSDTATFLKRYLDNVFQTDPVRAASLGCAEYSGRLPNVDRAYLEDADKTLHIYVGELARRIDDRTTNTTREEMLDLKVAKSDASHRAILQERMPWWTRAPYVYVEQIGNALTQVATSAVVKNEAPDQINQLLATVPSFLSAAERNLVPKEIPALYFELALEAATGLTNFIRTDIEPSLIGSASTMINSNRSTVEAAHDAIDGYIAWIRSVQNDAAGTWAFGPDHFDALLRDYYLLDLDATSVHELGLQAMQAHRAEVIHWAKEIDNNGADWRSTVLEISKHHATRESLLSAYQAHIDRSRAHTLSAALVSIPEGEEFQLGTVPTFLRSSLPMGVMHLAPPFAGSLKSEWLITPVLEGDEGHLRESCYAYMASISGHETYPGHHLQRVHHNLATKSSPIRASYTNPMFVEGWGLYVEDLLAETGFMDTAEVMLFKARHALWRSARMVIDTGLHTQGWDFERAVNYLVDEVSLGRRMATGEIRRYVRHDDATYPSSYSLGSMGFHQLRDQWEKMTGGKGQLSEFHDQVLSYGSIPLALVEGELR